MDYETQEKLRPTKEEREAKKEQARKDAEKALIALKKADEAFRANFERLKAERRARESASGCATCTPAGTRCGRNKFIALLELSVVSPRVDVPRDSEGLQLRLGGLLRFTPESFHQVVISGLR